MKRLLTLLLLLPGDALALESRLLDAAGKGVSGAQVSVVDQAGSARTDINGRFTLIPDPRLPARLLIVGSRGELYPPVYITTRSAEIRLEPAYSETVTVTTGATPNIEGTPASAPTVIGAEDIEQRKPAHVVDAIAATPGVSIRGEGPPAVPVVRGLAGGRTLLIIDDARIVAERRAGPSATFVDPLSLGSIEISRGPGTVAYGSDAIGGVLHLRPRDPVPGKSDYDYSAWGSSGGSEARSIAADVSADLFGGSILAAVHARSADDSHDANGNPIVNSGYEDRGLMLRYVRDSEAGRMRVGFMTSMASDIGAPTSDTVLTLYPDENAALLTFAVDRQQSGFLSSTSFRAALGSYDITTNRIRTTGVETATVEARDASVRLSGEHAFSSSLVTGGIDFVSRFDVHANPSIDDADRHDFGLYATWSGDVSSRWQLAAGGRGDHISSRNSGGFFGDISRSDVAFSGFGAATLALFTGASATVQIASAYREPTLSDRYFRGISGRGFVVGNPLLEPERTVQFDSSLRWSGASSRAALYVYHYSIRDLVERFRNGADFNFRNRGEATVRGIEIEYARRVLPNLDVQLGSAIARGEDEGSGAPLDDISPPALHASVRWAAQRASAFATLSTFGRDDRPGPVETTRAGYTELDLGGGWRFSPHFEVRVVVRNVANAHRFGSTDAVAAFAPGRSFVIGINR